MSQVKRFLLYSLVTFFMMGILSGVIYLLLGGKLHLGSGVWAVLQMLLSLVYWFNLFRTGWSYGKQNNSGGLLGLVLSLLLPLAQLLGAGLGWFGDLFLAPFQPVYGLFGIGQYGYVVQTVFAFALIGTWYLSKRKSEESK